MSDYDQTRLEYWMPGETPVQRTLREAHKAFRRRDLQPVESKGGYWKVELKAAHRPSFPLFAKRCEDEDSFLWKTFPHI